MLKVKSKIIHYIVVSGISFLLLGAAFGWFKTDFNLLRWYVSIFSFLLAWITFDSKNWRWFYGFLIIILIFNPFFRFFSLSKLGWQIIDIITCAFLSFFVFDYYRAYAKGIRFEKYISNLFPKNLWVLTDRTKDSSKNFDRTVESDMNPDLTFRNILTGKTIAIECKFRSTFYRGKYQDFGYWWKKEQGERYKKYGKKMNVPVFVALGIGGTPQKPNRLFISPLETLNEAPYGFVTEKMLKPFEKNPAEKILEI